MKATEDPTGAIERRRRAPWKAAVLSVVTLTVYGFWWWFDVNRQLREAGARVDPRRSLASVTVGWLGIVFPFRSVRETTTALAEIQRGADLPDPIRPDVAVGIAAVAIAGLVLFTLSGVFPPAFFLFGWIPPASGMAFVWYVQRELNRVALAPDRAVTAGSRPAEPRGD